MKKIRLSTIALDRDTFIGGTLETFEDDEGIYRSTITDMRFYQDKNGPELHVAVSSELKQRGKRWVQEAAGSTIFLRSPYKKPLTATRRKDGRIVVVASDPKNYFRRAVFYPRGVLQLPPCRSGPQG
jgi:hypothetical protein